MEKQHFLEIDLILSALNFFVHFESGQAEPLQRKVKAISDWGSAITLASRHRVLPFVTLALDKAGAFKDIPAETRALMEKDVQQAVLDNRVKMAEFRKYNRYFEDAGIPVIPLKGIALTQTVYKETPVRRMGDIDLLIKEKDVPVVHRILEGQNFFIPPLINRWHTGINERIGGKGSRVRGDIDIDLQWRPLLFIEGEFAVWLPEEGWQNAKQCPSLGSNVYLLSPSCLASHLLFQAGHDFSQDYLFLYQLLDLALVINKHRLQTEEFLKREAALEPASRKILQKLIKATVEFFSQPCELMNCSKDAQTIYMAIVCSALVPKNKLFFTKVTKLRALSVREKIFMTLGYFFPEPRYVLLKYGQGMRAFWIGWKNHWIRLIGKLFKVATGRFK